MKNRRAHAVEKLSEKGRAIVVRMLMTRERPSYAQIGDALASATGETVSASSMSRYYRNVLMEEEKLKAEELREARVAAAEIVGAIKAAGDSADAEQIAEDLLMAGLVQNQDAIRNADPKTLLKESRLRRQLDLQERQLELEIRKLRAEREAAKDALKKAEETGKPISKEALRRIREEVYGIV